MEVEKVNLKDYIYDRISEYDEEYAQEQGINNLDEEDINNILANVLDNEYLRQMVQQEIEEYASYKIRR